MPFSSCARQEVLILLCYSISIKFLHNFVEDSFFYWVAVTRACMKDKVAVVVAYKVYKVCLCVFQYSGNSPFLIFPGAGFREKPVGCWKGNLYTYSQEISRDMRTENSTFAMENLFTSPSHTVFPTPTILSQTGSTIAFSNIKGNFLILKHVQHGHSNDYVLHFMTSETLWRALPFGVIFPSPVSFSSVFWCDYSQISQTSALVCKCLVCSFFLDNIFLF